MNIVVCIKQVPGTSNVKVDPETGVLIRSGVKSKMNPYDLFALELGIELKEKYGGSLRVVSMGPPQAAAVLREAVYMGADSGILVSDRRFGGADVLATSYTLSQALKVLGDYDLIITGKQTTDGDTAQVGAELAEFLGVPHFAGVKELEQLENGRIRYVANLDNKIITATTEMPCVICAEAEINTPRLPSYRRQLEVEKSEEIIITLGLEDFEDTNIEKYGLKGSPTNVEKIFPPEKNTNRVYIEGDGEKLANELLSVLKTEKFI